MNVPPGAERRASREEASLRDRATVSSIVETAIDAGATVILTEDLQHGQVIDGVRVVNPFASVGAF